MTGVLFSPVSFCGAADSQIAPKLTHYLLSSICLTLILLTFILIMALGEVTGADEDELAEMREQFKGTPGAKKYDFEEMFCLNRIGKQPEDYVGPVRYCSRYAVTRDDGTKGISCPFHGGDKPSGQFPEYLDPLANMKHGIYANPENLFNDLKDYEQEIWDEIMTEWPEKYDVDFEADPSAKDDFYALAVEIIRDVRMNYTIDDRGIVVKRDVHNAAGAKIGEEEIANYLIKEEQAQRKLIMRLKDETLLSRKSRKNVETSEDATNTVADLVGGISNALDKDEHEYDPDEFADEE